MDNCLGMLEEYRAQIDTIDQQIIEFLSARFNLSQRIGALKREVGEQVFQSNRASEVKKHYVNTGGLHELDCTFMSKLYELVHEESCRIQESLPDISGKHQTPSRRRA